MPIVALFIATASHFMVESVRYTAKLRGACDRPLRLVASYRLPPVNRCDGRPMPLRTLAAMPTPAFIPMSPVECAAFGQAWTHQAITTTGATDSARALRLLDPSVTVTGH